MVFKILKVCQGCGLGLPTIFCVRCQSCEECCLERNECCCRECGEDKSFWKVKARCLLCGRCTACCLKRGECEWALRRSKAMDQGRRPTWKSQRRLSSETRLRSSLRKKRR